jgi:methyl acetate hydrolase
MQTSKDKVAVITGDSVDQVLQEAVSSGEFPGAVAGVVLGNGNSYKRAFGKHSVAEDREMREDSIFRIASMIKPVIAVAALQLYEQGMFDLDDPAGHYLPAISDLQVLDGFDDEGKPILREPHSQITIRQLFTQTSGLAYHVLNKDLRRYVESYPEQNLNGERLYRKLPMIDDPGKRWHYGVNTSWLSDLIETLSGQELKTYFARNIFEPLGMIDTYCRRMPAEKEHRLVTHHTRQPDGTLVEAPQEIWDPPFCGSLGLVTTAGDFMAFMQMILNRGLFGGKQILRPETGDMMAKNHIGDIHVAKMESAVPEFIDFEFFPESRPRNKWGLGFHLNGDAVKGGRSRYSLSWAGRYNTYFWIDIQQQVAAVLLLQTEPSVEPRAVELLARFERAVYAGIE